MTAARSLLFQALFYLASAVLSILFLPLLALPWHWMMRAGTIWSALTLKLLEWCCGVTWELRGREHLPQGPAVVAMKHQSAWDTLAVPVIFPSPAIVIKRELLWVPFYGWFAKKAGMIAIDRKAGANALRRMMAQAERAAAAGRKIIIFPEGTRTAVGSLPAYQPGVYALYRRLDLPLVPVAVNSGLYWGRRHFSKRAGKIIVEILPPMPPGGERRMVMAALEHAIEDATQRLVAEGR